MGRIYEFRNWCDNKLLTKTVVLIEVSSTQYRR